MKISLKLRILGALIPCIISGVVGASATSIHRDFLHLPSTATALFIYNQTTTLQQPNTLFASIAAPDVTITSIGTGGNWNAAGTWSPAQVPVAGDIVIIKSGTTVTINNDQSCNNITIEPGGTLQINGTNKLTVTGNWQNNGTFTTSVSGIIEFAGSTSTTISGSQTTNFKNLVVNKTPGRTTLLEINGTATILSGGLLTMTSGLLQINASGDLDCNHNTQINISTAAGIHVNGGNFSTGDFSVNNNGLFQVSSGTATLGADTGNSLQTGTNGTFQMDGGTLNIAGRLVNTAGTANITGGTINLSTLGHASSTLASFEMSSSTILNITGGTITFTKPNGSLTNPTDIVLISGGGAKTISGGTFQFGTAATTVGSTFIVNSDIPFNSLAVFNNNSEISLQLSVPVGGTSYTVLVGDNNGGPTDYLPVTLSFGGGNAADAWVAVQTINTQHPNNQNTDNYLNRYWAVETSGINGSWDFSATYSVDDVIGDAANIDLGTYDGSVWTKGNPANTGANTISITGITASSLEISGISDVLPEITFDNGDSQTICYGSSVKIETTVTGDPTLTFAWTPATNLSATNIEDPVASPTVTTNYMLTVTDGNGFQASKAVTINVNPLLSASISSQTNVSCFGGSNGSATVNVTGGTTNYSYSWNTSPIQTTATATGLTAGTYTVTVTDANNCTTTATAVITQPAAALSASISAQTNVLCFGNSTGSATVTPVGGTAGYTYSWSPSGGNNATATGLAAGTYTVTVTDANNCTTTATAVITQPAAALSASISAQTNVLCFGNSTGSATVIPVGGTAGYTYSWSPSGGNNATATGLTAGTYTVTVTDANNCTTTAIATITQPAAALSASISAQTNVFCFGGSNGEATVSATGGTANYSYSWNTSPIQTTATATGLAAGTYTVTVTDANNCSTTATAVITQPAAALAASISSQTNVSCFGGSNGSATVNVTGGTTNYSYSWNTSPIQTTATATGLAAGTYTVTVTDANNCTTTATAVITQPAAALSASISAQTNVLCFGNSTGSTTVTPNGGTAGYTFLWSNGQTTATATGLIAGTYTVTVTDANNCTTTATAVITQPAAALSASISAQTNVLCFGNSTGSATVTPVGGTAGYTYSWSPSGGNNATATGLAAGTYTVTVTDANNCTTTATAVITQPAAALSASISTQTNVLCFGNSTGSVTVTPNGGTAGYTYSWSNGQTTATATGLIAGTYTVTVTDANGCTANTSATITEPAAALAASISSQTNVSCFGGSNGIATVNTTGGTAGYTYLWSNGQTTATATGLIAGTYTVTVTDANGCTANTSATITQPPVVVLNTPTVTNVKCNGGTDGQIVVSASGGTGTINYSISPNIGIQSPSGTFINLTAGTYTITATDGNGCTKTTSATITQPTAITVSTTSNSVVCEGSTLNLTTESASGGTGPYTYSWTGPNGWNSTSQNPSITNASRNATGDYTLTVTDANGCSTSTIRNAIVNPVTNMTMTPAFASGFVKKATNQKVLYQFTITNTGYVPDYFNLTYLYIQDDNDFVEMDVRFLTTENVPITLTPTLAVNQSYSFQVELSVQGNSPRVLNHTKITATSHLCPVSKTTSDIYTYEYNGNLPPDPTNAALEIYKTASVASPTVGTAFNYIIDLVNNTTAVNATNVIMSDQIPASLTITNAAAIIAAGGSISGNTITWNIGTLNKIGGGVSSIQKIVSVMPTCSSLPSVTNTVNVISTPQDVDLTNNTASITLNVTDPTPPTAICKNADVYLDASGNATITAAMVNNGSTDNCGIQSITVSPNTFTCANMGANSVTLTVTDFGGNTSACVTQVFVYDNIRPTWVTAAGALDATVQCSDLTALNNAQSLLPTATDNCTTSFTVQKTAGSFVSSGCANSGTYTNTFVVSDYSGNQVLSAFTQTITVIDNTNPTIVCSVSGTQTKNINSGVLYVHADNSWNASASDNCSLINNGLTLTAALSGATNTTGHASLNGVSFNIGTTTVTWTARDACNNTSTCSFTVEVLGTADITVSKTATATIATGASMTYTITVTNNGPATAPQITLSDAVPAVLLNQEFSINGGTSWNTWTGTHTINNLIANDFKNILIRGKVDCAGSGNINNTASVTLSPITDPNPGNNSSTTVSTLISTLPLDLSASISNVSCSGLNDGAINLTVAGGTTPYTFAWSNGATSEDISGLIAGTYSVTVTDANGCTISGSYTVGTAPDVSPPTFTLITTDLNFCVKNIEEAIFNESPTLPDYDDLTTPRPDHYRFKLGDFDFDLDKIANNYNDNCCDVDDLELHWEIIFSPTPDPSTVPHNPITKPAITDQTVKPSAYGTIDFPADGVTHNEVTHQINYWLVDCNGNPAINPVKQTVYIHILPRPAITRNF